MDYFWSPDAVRGCLGCLMKVLSDATNSFTYLHYNSMELGPLRAGGGAKRPLLRVYTRGKIPGQPGILQSSKIYIRAHRFARCNLTEICSMVNKYFNLWNVYKFIFTIIVYFGPHLLIWTKSEKSINIMAL